MSHLPPNLELLSDYVNSENFGSGSGPNPNIDPFPFIDLNPDVRP